MRPAISSTESTFSAISMRRMLAKLLMSTGIFEPFGFSNSSAGPPFFTERSANSVISSFGSTSKEMRFSSLFFSRARMKSRRSSYAMLSMSIYYHCKFTWPIGSHSSRAPAAASDAPAPSPCRPAARRSCWPPASSTNSKKSPTEIRAAGGEAFVVPIDLASQDSIKEAFCEGVQRVRTHRHPGQQRRPDARRSGHAHEARRLGRRAADQSLRLVLLHSAGAARDGARAVGKNREHHVGGRRVRQRGPGELRGVESGADRADEIARAGTGLAQHHRQRRCAGLRRNRYDGLVER